MFLLPGLNLELRPTLLKMKPGTRVVANQFDMGDWVPDEQADILGPPGTSLDRAGAGGGQLEVRAPARRPTTSNSSRATSASAAG